MRHRKEAASISIIGGEDGPTAVFLAGRIGDKGKDRKAERRRRKRERALKRAARKMVPGTHTLEQVEEYIRSKYETEDCSASPAGQRECRMMKINLILGMRPDLAGAAPSPMEIDWNNREEREAFLKAEQQKEERAAAVPEEEFPLECRCYHIPVRGRGRGKGTVRVTMEKRYEQFHISCQWSGRGAERRVKQIMKDLYRYYGVSQEDISQRTDRFQRLAMMIKRL